MGVRNVKICQVENLISFNILLMTLHTLATIWIVIYPLPVAYIMILLPTTTQTKTSGSKLETQS